LRLSCLPALPLSRNRVDLPRYPTIVGTPVCCHQRPAWHFVAEAAESHGDRKLSSFASFVYLVWEDTDTNRARLNSNVAGALVTAEGSTLGSMFVNVTCERGKVTELVSVRSAGFGFGAGRAVALKMAFNLVFFVTATKAAHQVSD
jgi:hypothetical protein